MSLPIIEIANRQRLDVFADGPKGANRLLIYTGIAILDGSFVINNMLVHDTAEIILGQNSIKDITQGDNFNGNPLAFINGTVSVALAAISDQGNSDNVTWATDSTELDLVPIDPNTNFLKIRVNCGIQGESTSLLRISYTAFISAKDSTPDLVSLVFDPRRIAFDSNKPWSTGTVTLSGPAPSDGVAVQLSTDRPDLLTIPATVIVAAGATDVTFKAVLLVKPGGIGVVKAQVTASAGKGHQSFTLDLL